MTRISSATKMLPCTACMPKGCKGKARHEYTAQDWNAEPVVWGWRCENCGHFKKPRAQQDRVSYEFVTKLATSDAKLSNVNSVRFHCFNSNGLYAKWNAVAAKVGDWVDANPDKPNGVLLVYGSLNDYPRKRLFDLLDKKAAVTSTELYVAVKMVRDDIAKAEAWLAEKVGKEDMKP